MATIDSTQAGVAQRTARAQFEEAFTRSTNLLYAIDQLASAYIDRDVVEIERDASYYAGQMHKNASAIVGLASVFKHVLEHQLMPAFDAATTAAAAGKAQS